MNSSTFLVKQTLINDLKELQSKKISCVDFASKYAKINTEKETNGQIPDIRNIIDIYLDEENIREEDAQYKAMQEGELSKLINLLENNATSLQIQNINFLGESVPLTSEEIKKRRLSNFIFFIKLILVLIFVFYAPVYALKLIQYITETMTGH